ncbi:MAG TPA: ATP-grasp domain-containing protein [Pyrinomonadaceae bacterium]
MSETPTRVENVVCVASFFKGADFLRECRARGARVFLVTRERTLGEEWPREAIDDLVAIPNDASLDLFLYAVSHLARRVRIDRVVALEEFDVVNTALLREQLQVPGMHGTAARAFRDKLTMRVRAREAGIRVPDFVHVLNHEALHAFMTRVSAPWVLKPRSDVSSIGIKKLHDPEQVWRAIDELDARGALHERSPYYVLEQYVAGEVFHVDSLVEDGEVTFAGVNRYGRPPLDVAQQGGVYISHTLDYDSEDRARLEEFNRRLLKSLRLESGAAHAEFIKGEADGEFYFLEVASRVGGAYMAETLEAASGVNLWREWARLELAGGSRAAEERPQPRREYGGIALSLARQEWPDTSQYTDAEIVGRVRKAYHVGLVVGSPSLARVEELLDDYARRFAADFCAVAPPHERPPL